MVEDVTRVEHDHRKGVKRCPACHPSLVKVKAILIVPDVAMRKKIEDAARAEHRKLGPMAMEIIRRYFSRVENDAKETASTT